jgi:hypothetical protein
MMDKKLYIGIDIHSKEQVIAILPSALLNEQSNNWKKYKSFSIKNNAADYKALDSKIRHFAPDIRQVCIAIDHTGGHYSAPLVHFLNSKGYDVFYLASMTVKAAKERFLGEENKTDKLDAAVLAYLLFLRDSQGSSLHITATIADLNSSATLLRSLILQRKQYVKLSTQTISRLHQYLLAVFPEGESKYFKQLLKIVPYYQTPEDMLNRNRLEDINGITDEERISILRLADNTVGIPGDQYRWIIKDNCIQRAEAQHKVTSFYSMIKKEVNKHPYGEILCSFPYIGEIIAATLIGIIKDIDYWSNKKKLKKALGVYGRQYISGYDTNIRRSGKGGYREGKSALFQACLGCLHRDLKPNDFRDYYERQLNHGKMPRKAMASTCGKMAEIIFHCLKSGEKYNYMGKYKHS